MTHRLTSLRACSGNVDHACNFCVQCDLWAERGIQVNDGSDWAGQVKVDGNGGSDCRERDQHVGESGVSLGVL